MLIIIGLTESTIERVLKPGPLKDFLFRERRIGHSILEPVRDVIRDARDIDRRRSELGPPIVPPLDRDTLLPP
jgi:hypothetical protein